MNGIVSPKRNIFTSRRVSYGMWEPLAILGLIVTLLVTFAAMVTHVIACIKTASWILLAIGVFLPFVGIIHGWTIWLGVAV